jgi:predicted transcriptional regulator YdeE
MKDPTLMEMPDCRVVGIVYSGGLADDVPALWKQFEPRIGEVKIEGACYGVIRPKAGGGWEYMAGFVSSAEPPTGMQAWDLEGGTFLRVSLSGLHEIRPTIHAFHEEWLPQSGYGHSDRATFEHYPESFPQDPALFLMFPIETK